ncbi:MAG: C25 family cysteine peptidase, partial [Chloroflexota bacterium]
MIPLILIRKSLLSLLTAVSLGGLFLFPQTNSQAAAAPAVIQVNGITRQQTSADSLSFTLVTPADPTAQANLETSGLNALIHEPGAPELPYFTTLIALPPSAEIHVTVTARGETAVANTYVPPAAQPTLANIDPANADFLPETAVLPQSAGERIPDDAIYQSDSRYPQTRYRVSQPMYYHDIRLVRLELFPIQYNPLKQERYHAAQLDVDITFSGGSLNSLHPAPSAHDAYQQTAASLILNFEQAQNWRSLPQNEGDMVETAVPLPTDRTSYKIELNQNGIYEITGAALAAAGMNITNTNPSTLQMMSRGEDVAYQLVNNGDIGKLDPTDVIRFYGEAVHASRREKQFLSANVYWLWANGSATPIPTENNDTSGETATNFLEAITREDENGFTSTYNNQWPAFPNEPDSWGWQLVRRNGTILTNPLTRLPNEMPTLNLPDPELNSGTTVTSTVEMIPYNTRNGPYQVTVCINSDPTCGSLTWSGIKNVNITSTAPITSLVNGVNTINVDLSNPPGFTNDLSYYINRITVEYLRALKASDNQLIFTDSMGGRAMVVEGFSTNNPAQFLIWDITTPKQPVALEIESGDISGAPGSYTLTLGRNSTGAQQYIATTLTNTLSGSETVAISAYTPPANLEPAAGADWIAISHADFLPQANNLAAHRANPQFGGLKTHVIDIEDVVNVYGYGLPLPDAIHTYLKNALYNWTTAPGYVVLLGDATVSPRNLDCSTVTQNGLRFCSVWDKDAKTFIPTDMLFTDRFQGLIPSDQTAVLLAGDDMLPDMAIGRLPANNAAQATNMVAKIIQYEQNQLNTQPNGAWQKNVLFLADKTDAAGNFCLTNQTITGPLLPATFPQEHLCLDNYTSDDNFTAEEKFREDMSAALSAGVSL